MSKKEISEPKEHSKGTIAIIAFKINGVAPWDPDSIKKGITGSEEAVVYISLELAKLGYSVTVFGDPPKNSFYSHESSNPKYLPIDQFTNEFVDIAIAWRMSGLPSLLKQFSKNIYLWPHDTLYQKMEEEEILGFDDVFWLSNWQRNQWISVNPLFSKFNNIFGNGITPINFFP